MHLSSFILLASVVAVTSASSLHPVPYRSEPGLSRQKTERGGLMARLGKQCGLDFNYQQCEFGTFCVFKNERFPGGTCYPLALPGDACGGKDKFAPTCAPDSACQRNANANSTEMGVCVEVRAEKGMRCAQGRRVTPGWDVKCAEGLQCTKKTGLGGEYHGECV